MPESLVDGRPEPVGCSNHGISFDSYKQATAFSASSSSVIHSAISSDQQPTTSGHDVHGKIQLACGALPPYCLHLHDSIKILARHAVLMQENGT